MGRGRFGTTQLGRKATHSARTGSGPTVFLITVDIRRATDRLTAFTLRLQGHSLRLAYRPSTAGQLSETQVTSKVLLLIIALVLCRLSLILLYGLTDVKIRQAIG